MVRQLDGRVNVAYGAREFAARNWQWLVGTGIGAGGLAAAFLTVFHWRSVRCAGCEVEPVSGYLRDGTTRDRSEHPFSSELPQTGECNSVARL